MNTCCRKITARSGRSARIACVLALTMVFLWITACGSNETKDITPWIIDGTDELETVSVRGLLREFAVPCLNKEFGASCYQNDLLYYALLEIEPMSQGLYANSVEILCYDTNKQDYSVLYRYDNDATYANISKMGVYGDNLCWLLETSESKWYVQIFNLTDQSVTTVKEGTIETGWDIAIEVQENYLLWYEFSEDGSFTCFAFDIDTGSIIDFTDEHQMISSPYWLPTVHNETAVFCVKENDSLLLVTKSVSDQQVLSRVSIPSDFAYAFHNGDSIVWNSKFGRGTIYLYDTETKEVHTLYQAGLNESVHFRLYGQHVILFSSKSGQPMHISVIDYEEKKCYTPEDLPEMSFVLLGSSKDSYLVRAKLEPESIDATTVYTFDWRAVGDQ